MFYYVDMPTIDDNLEDPTWRCEKNLCLSESSTSSKISFLCLGQPWRFEEKLSTGITNENKVFLEAIVVILIHIVPSESLDAKEWK